VLENGVVVGQRAARSLPERWPALPFAVRIYEFKAINARHWERGSLVAAPFQSGAKMDAKTRDSLLLLAALSLFCASVAWSADRAVFASVFVALSAIAAFNAVAPRPRGEPRRRIGQEKRGDRLAQANRRGG
jgi:hypothetical protein